MVSGIGAKRTTGPSPDLEASRRRDLLFPCKTAGSAVATPRNAVQSWPGFSKETWYKGVAAWAANAVNRQHSRRIIGGTPVEPEYTTA